MEKQRNIEQGGDTASLRKLETEEVLNNTRRETADLRNKIKSTFLPKDIQARIPEKQEVKHTSFFDFLLKYYEKDIYAKKLYVKQFSEISARWNKEYNSASKEERKQVSAKFLEELKMDLNDPRMKNFFDLTGQDKQDVAKNFSPKWKATLVRNCLQNRKLGPNQKKLGLVLYFNVDDILQSLGYKPEVAKKFFAQKAGIPDYVGNPLQERKIKYRFVDEIVGLHAPEKTVKTSISNDKLKTIQTVFRGDSSKINTILSLNETQQKKINQLSGIELEKFLQYIVKEAARAKTSFRNTGIDNPQRLDLMTALSVGCERLDEIAKKAGISIKTPGEAEVRKIMETRGTPFVGKNTPEYQKIVFEAKRADLTRQLTLLPKDKQEVYKKELNEIDKNVYIAAQAAGEIKSYEQMWGSERTQEIKTYIYESHIQANTIQENNPSKNLFTSTEIAKTIKENTAVDSVFKEPLELSQFNELSLDSLQRFAEKQGEKPEEIKKRLEEQTTQIIKEQAVESCLNTLNTLFDVQFKAGEKSRNEEIKSNPQSKITMEGEIVHIKGLLGKEEIEVNYNIKTGEIHTEQFIWMRPDLKQDGFEVNMQRFKNIPIRMPSLDQYRDKAKNIQLSHISPQNFSEEIKKEVYLQTQDLLPNGYEKTIFSKEIQKNVLAQDLLEMVGIETSLPKNILTTSENYEIYKYVFESTESYSSEELQTMRSLIKRYKNRESASPIPNNPEQGIIKRLAEKKDPTGKMFKKLFNLLGDRKQEVLDKKVISISKFIAFLDESEKFQKNEVTMASILKEDIQYQSMINDETLELAYV